MKTTTQRSLNQWWTILLAGSIAWLNAQKPIPLEIPVQAADTSGKMPIIYFAASNYLKLEAGNTSVDSVTFADGNPNHFQIKRDTALLKDAAYVVEIFRNIWMEDSLKYPYDLPLNVYAADGKVHRISLPVGLFPPVMIKYIEYASNHPLSNLRDTITGIDSIICKAEWDYPAYAKSMLRFRGHYDITLQLENGVIVERMEGWYDRGDYTRIHSLAQFKGIAKVIEAVIDLKSLKTLNVQYHIKNCPYAPIRLSDKTPQKVIFKL